MTTTTTKRTLRTVLISGAAILALGAAALAYYLLSPSGYLSLDINPSIEIRTNRLNQVTSVIGANKDGQTLLEGYRPDDNDLDDVIEDLVDRMVLQGYLGSGKANDVLVTVDDDTVPAKTLEQVNAKIESYVSKRNLTANIVAQSVNVDDDLLEEADKYHVSAGKMSVIDQLAAGSPTLKPEELAGTRISDLFSYAKEKNIPLELLEERLDDLEDRYDDNPHLENLEDGLDDTDDRNDTDDFDDNDDLNDDLDDLDDLDDNQPIPSRPAPNSQKPPVLVSDDDYDDDNWDDQNDDDLDDRKPASSKPPVSGQKPPVLVSDDDNDDWDDRSDDDNDDWDDDDQNDDNSDDDDDDNDD